MQSRALRVDHLAANTNPAISAAASSCIAGMACESVVVSCGRGPSHPSRARDTESSTHHASSQLSHVRCQDLPNAHLRTE